MGSHRRRCGIVSLAFALVGVALVIPTDAALSKVSRRLRIRRRIRKRVSGTADRPSTTHRIVVTADDFDSEINSIVVSLGHTGNNPIPTGGATTCRDLGHRHRGMGGMGGATCETAFTLERGTSHPQCDEADVAIFATDVLFETDPAVGLEYHAGIEMRDATNRKIGKSKKNSRVTIEAAAPPHIANLLILQLDGSNFLIRTEVEGGDDVVRVDIELTDRVGNSPHPESMSIGLSQTTATSVGGTAFMSKMLTFEDPTSAAGAVYGAVVSVYDESNTLLGTTDFDVVVESLHSMSK
eukprot:m.227863 g.227863  ORF g.227863 m.227863 type:complete len:296 (-) comp25957_c0_seq1:51-938(-)